MRQQAPWLLAPELTLCAVGSTALAEACRRQGVQGPRAADLDLAWSLDIDSGRTLLEEHGVFVDTTEANRGRGTLAMKLGRQRIEITSFRGEPSDDREVEIERDLRLRDMTVGALAWWLEPDRILDPLEGLQHWIDGRVVPVGDPADRIREHPVRWLRYYRRAATWGFDLDNRIRKVDLARSVLADCPPEAIAQEFRAALLECASPGRLFLELFEQGLLQQVAPELALQFDGRPAGPVRHHPEVSQALHLILALEWAVQRSGHLTTTDRLTLLVAVLCHDLGKGTTSAEQFPSHPGHETGGVELIQRLFERLPGLADSRMRRLVEAVAVLHLTVRRMDELRPGTRADLYQRWFKGNDFPIELFALALAADVGGRLGMAAEGEDVARRVRSDVEWVRAQCATVDAGELYERFGKDKERFRSELHQAYARVLRR